MILTIIGIIAALVAFYAVLGRDLLKGTTWGSRIISFIEPVELALWRKSETILWARFKVLIGALLAVLTSVGTLDLTPFVTFLPNEHQDIARKIVGLLPLVISVVGLIDENLRRNTTKPLAVVAVPSNAPSAVAEAVQAVEESNREAVAAVTEARAEGKV